MSEIQITAENKTTLLYPRVAVRAIIQNENSEVLILKRYSTDYMGGKWCLPGGKIDFGLSAEEAIRNEVKEETDLDCVNIRFLFYLDGLPSNEYNDHYITLYFKCDVKGIVKLNDESQEYCWVNQFNKNNYELVFGNDRAIEQYIVLNE